MNYATLANLKLRAEEVFMLLKQSKSIKGDVLTRCTAHFISFYLNVPWMRLKLWKCNYVSLAYCPTT